MRTPLRGAVYIVDLGLAAKVRPCLVPSSALRAVFQLRLRARNKSRCVPRPVKHHAMLQDPVDQEPIRVHMALHEPGEIALERMLENLG